jgi:hypothetical protein
VTGEGPAGPTASGARSISIDSNTGTAITGDHARLTQVAAGALRAPDQVPTPTRLVGLPREPVDPFVGRDTDLASLRQVSGVAVVTQAVYGLGGVGKSELALQYATRNADCHALVWWAAAEDPDGLQASLAELARRLEPAHALLGTTTDDAAGWVVQWLQAHPGWLLILDNVEERSTVAPLLAQVARHGSVIITTRRDINWRGSVRPLSLDVLTAEAAITLLASISGRPGEGVALAELAAELGYLPLALEQAGAYIAEQRIGVEKYLGLLRERPAEAFQGVDQGGQASRTIARVWDITLAAIGGREPSAAFLLEVLAYFAPNAIPRRYLTAASTDVALVDRALGVLAS